MKLISVNVSPPKEIQYKGESVTTGIFKEPVQGRIMLRKLNLDGDGQADLTVHGGAHQAVYVYPLEHYDYWKQKLGRQDLPYGQFGENFTVAEMREDQVHVGDIFRVGSAAVQITQPRVPCYKLAIRMNLPQFPKLFMASGRTGFYLRVLQAGEVGGGDMIERVEIAPEKMTVREIFHLAFRDHDDHEALEKALRVRGLSPGWHGMFAERLAAR